MKRIALASVIVTAAAAMLSLHAQSSRQTPTSTSKVSITGVIVVNETGHVIPNARVALMDAPGAPPALADADGRFHFTVPPGRHRIVASKTGYTREEVSVIAPGAAVSIRLRRGAVISGRIVDEFGDPVPGARVSAASLTSSRTEGATMATVESDDQGEYRLPSLSPGRMTVSVSTMAATTIAVAGTPQVMVRPTPHKLYYPGVAEVAAAEALQLQSGEERDGIDFRLSADAIGGQPLSVSIPGPLSRPIAHDLEKPSSGVIRGRVLTTAGRALPYAQVRLVSQKDPRQGSLVRANDLGRFEFSELPAGTYRLIASKVGYAPLAAISPTLRSAPVSIALASDERREGVEVTLARWGTLTGRVFDELGDPVQGANVQLLHVRYVAGRRRLVPAGGIARATDDFGRYRVYLLPADRYVVSASVGDVRAADVPGYARSYFPGTPNAGEAQFVPIGVSQNVAGVDIRLSRIRTGRVAGQLLDASGQPTTGGSLTLIPSYRSASPTSVSVGARIFPGGLFEFPNVPPGDYIIQAYRGRSNPSTEGEFGALRVAVNGDDVTDLVLQASAGSSIAGRFLFDADPQAKPPARSALELSPMPVDFDLSPSNVASADIHDDWTFTMTGINGPRRLELTQAPPEWALKEIRVNGIDITDRPLSFGRGDQSLTGVEVVLTTRISEVSGTVTAGAGRAAIGSIVVVYSMDRDRWYPQSRYLRKADADDNGAFTVAGLPMGSYFAAATAQAPSEGEAAWQDPAFLDALLPRASIVTVMDGQKTTIALRLPQ
jgi:Carboxypeptidase regulatory-like domain